MREGGCAVTEAFECCQRLVAQLERVGLGRFQAEQGRVGRFVAGDIGPWRLPRVAVSLSTSRMSSCTEGQANGLCITLQGLELRLAGAGAGQGAKAHAGFDQGASLVPVHVFKGALVELEAHRAQVDGLAADHARWPSSLGQSLTMARRVASS